ncbi:AMP-binding protein, partial [Thermodesulfobacteriota bacterium]
MNISHLLVNSTQKYPHKIGIVSGKNRFSYRTINERTNRLAQAMKRSGLGKGDRVALLMYNTHHFVEVYFACLKLGAIAVPVNYRFVGREIKYVVTNSEAIAIFFDSAILKGMAGLCQELDTVKTFVGIDVAQDQQIQNYEAFLSAGNTAEPQVSAGSDDPCQIMYTSGTTGKPKGAVTSHNNLYWNLINTIVLREHRLS